MHYIRTYKVELI